MACDTFIKIAQKCRRHFVMQQSGETEPFIDEILRTLPRITIDLSPHQVHTFYEAVGYMIAAQPNKPTQERLIAKLMELPNTAWDSLMQQAHNNVDVFGNSDNIKILSNILKTNVSACTSIGSYFLPQIGRIYLDMLTMYRGASTLIDEAVQRDGSVARRQPKGKQPVMNVPLVCAEDRTPGQKSTGHGQREVEQRNGKRHQRRSHRGPS